MIKEFSIFGSWASRMIFNSKINPNYNEFFRINESVEQVALISLMTSPIEIDKKYIENSNAFCRSCVNNDLSKNFLEFLKGG